MDRLRGSARWIVSATLCVCLGLAGTARADDDDGDMNPALEATIQLKLQSYDHKLAARIKKRFVIAILYKSGSKVSEETAITMNDAFTHVAETSRIRTLKPETVMIAVDAKLLDRLQTAGANMIYVTPGLEAAIAQIAAAGVQVQAPTVCHVRAQAVAGVGLAIVVYHNKPKIVVNLKAMVAQGMELDAEVLGLAEVLR